MGKVIARNVALAFGGTDPWEVLRSGEDLAAWAAVMADLRVQGRDNDVRRALELHWRAVGNFAFGPAYPDARAAFVLMPETVLGEVTTVMRLTRFGGLHPIARDGFDSEPVGDGLPLLEGGKALPLQTGAGLALLVKGTFAEVTDESTHDIGRLVAAYWWFPDVNTTIELRSIYSNIIAADRDYPAVQRLILSAEREGERGGGACALSVVPRPDEKTLSWDRAGGGTHG